MNSFFKKEWKKNAVYLIFKFEKGNGNFLFTNRHPLNSDCIFSKNESLFTPSEKEILKFAQSSPGVFDYNHTDKAIKNLLNSEILIYEHYSLKNLIWIKLFSIDKKLKSTLDSLIEKYKLNIQIYD